MIRTGEYIEVHKKEKPTHTHTHTHTSLWGGGKKTNSEASNKAVGMFRVFVFLCDTQQWQACGKLLVVECHREKEEQRERKSEGVNKRDPPR